MQIEFYRCSRCFVLYAVNNEEVDEIPAPQCKVCGKDLEPFAVIEGEELLESEDEDD